MHFFHMDFFPLIHKYRCIGLNSLSVLFKLILFSTRLSAFAFCLQSTLLVLHHFTLTVLVTSPWPGFRCLFLFSVLNMPLSTATSMTMKTDGRKVKEK